MCKYLTLCILFISQLSIAGSGYVFTGDLNGDGVEDSIKSGPLGLFGNAGGPFMVSLSKSDGTFVRKVIGFHINAIALETNEAGINNLWGYWRGGSQQGSLFKVSLDGNFKHEGIAINVGINGSDIGSSLYSSIFNNQHLLKLKKVENYLPPDYPWGKG